MPSARPAARRGQSQRKPPAARRGWPKLYGRVRSQWANKNLDSAEKFSLGGYGACAPTHQAPPAATKAEKQATGELRYLPLPHGLRVLRLLRYGFRAGEQTRLDIQGTFHLKSLSAFGDRASPMAAPARGQRQRCLALAPRQRPRKTTDNPSSGCRPPLLLSLTHTLRPRAAWARAQHFPGGKHEPFSWFGAKHGAAGLPGECARRRGENVRGADDCCCAGVDGS